MNKLPFDMACSIRPDARSLFDNNGFYIAPRIFSDEEIDKAVAAQDYIYRHGALMHSCAARLPEIKPCRARGNQKHPYASFFHKDLAAIARKPELGEMSAWLLQEHLIRYWHDQLLYAPPGQKYVDPNWHTERSRWLTCSSLKMLTAWIPFHTMTLSHGPITVIPGSHKWNLTGIEEMIRNCGSLETVAEMENLEKKGALPATISKGEVLFNHCLLVHGNPVNRASNPRRALAVHMMADCVRYQHYGEFKHVNEKFCRKTDSGDPDFVDPELFPVIFGSVGT